MIRSSVMTMACGCAMAVPRGSCLWRVWVDRETKGIAHRVPIGSDHGPVNSKFPRMHTRRLNPVAHHGFTICFEPSRHFVTHAHQLQFEKFYRFCEYQEQMLRRILDGGSSGGSGFFQAGISIGAQLERKSVVQGKSVELGGGGSMKKKQQHSHQY